MRALRTPLLVATLVAALLLPAATADPVVPTTCLEQDMGPATLTTCTPAVPECVAFGFGDGGLVSICFHEHEEAQDADGDGWTASQGDCDDADPSVHPGASEAPNGIDDDCDGQVDEGLDLDGDGHAMPNDCDDTSPLVSPDEDERPGDGRDNDCDGAADEMDPAGTDGDGDGVTVAGGDCDDTNGSSYPGAPEIADRKDNDCNGLAEA